MGILFFCILKTHRKYGGVFGIQKWADSFEPAVFIFYYRSKFALAYSAAFFISAEGSAPVSRSMVRNPL